MMMIMMMMMMMVTKFIHILDNRPWYMTGSKYHLAAPRHLAHVLKVAIESFRRRHRTNACQPHHSALESLQRSRISNSIPLLRDSRGSWKLLLESEVSTRRAAGWSPEKKHHDPQNLHWRGMDSIRLPFLDGGWGKNVWSKCKVSGNHHLLSGDKVVELQTNWSPTFQSDIFRPFHNHQYPLIWHNLTIVPPSSPTSQFGIRFNHHPVSGGIKDPQ